MGFFDKALKTVQSVGDSLVASATDNWFNSRNSCTG